MNSQRSLKSEPLVSIVTPSLNQGKFIEDTLLSVKNQDYPKIEHIVVDGGSTDNTIEVLKKYEGTYNLCWISEPDEGHADAVNKGFKMARGEIVGWLNSDDVYFERDTISIVVKAFQKHPEVDIIYGDCAYIGEDNTILRIQCVPNFRYNRLLRGCFLEQPAVFLRKHVVSTHTLDVHVKFAIDYEYWLRIGRLYHFYHIPYILAADRNHRDRISIVQAERLKSISKEIQRRYLEDTTFRLHLEWTIDKIISGLPRRIKGLIQLIRVSKKKNFAFDAKVVLNTRVLKNQLFPRGIEKLKL